MADLQRATGGFREVCDQSFGFFGGHELKRARTAGSASDNRPYVQAGDGRAQSVFRVFSAIARTYLEISQLKENPPVA